MTSAPQTSNRPEDELEMCLRCIELGGKTFSFIVPSLYKQHGDFLSEVLYACGNFASTIRKLYHSGLLLQTVQSNTATLVKKFVQTFEVVFECCAYKFGSKRIKWTVILLLQAFKLLISLYLTHVRQIVLDDRCNPPPPGNRSCRCGGGSGPPASAQEQRKPPAQQPHCCQNRPRLAELLHSARPLLHACLYVLRGRDSWLPWMASVATDALALSCLPSRGCLTRRQVECRAEWFQAAAVAYVFRTPFHDRLVRPVAAWLSECPVPLLSSLFKLVLTYLVYWRQYYANMWG